MIRRNIKIVQLNPSFDHDYRVIETTNCVHPKIDEYLNEQQVADYIAKGINVNIIRND